MSLSHDPGQLVVLGYPGTAPPVDLLAALGRGELGGVVLFRRNFTEALEVRSHTAAWIAAAPPELPPLIAVDQEGGRVARLGPPLLSIPAMRFLGRFDEPALTEQVGLVLGEQLRLLGFSCDFAPVLDVDTQAANPVIGDRAFSSHAPTVARHASAFAAGLARSGIIACGKHFPGHGDTLLDSHLALPRVEHDRARLERLELLPFRAATAIPMWMSAHVVYEALDPQRPATLSPLVLQALLRDELGYEGVLISDDLEMAAIQHDDPIEAAIEALMAGCDALMFCSRFELLAPLREALLRRSERDPRVAARIEEALGRFLALRRRYPAQAPLEAEAWRQRFDTEAQHALQRQLDRLREMTA